METCMRTPVRGSKRNVSEGLNSVETRSDIGHKWYGYFRVSEGLNSVETQIMNGKVKAFNGFQKNLVVWKLKKRGESRCKT